MIERNERLAMIATLVLFGVAGLLHFLEANAIFRFVLCALALAGVAHVIGEATDHLGHYLGPAATGIIQSAVGNLPELFVAIFALQAGLVAVVQASLIGSILANAELPGGRSCGRPSRPARERTVRGDACPAKYVLDTCSISLVLIKVPDCSSE